jgi:hypothetical protein
MIDPFYSGRWESFLICVNADHIHEALPLRGFCDFVRIYTCYSVDRLWTLNFGIRGS